MYGMMKRFDFLDKDSINDNDVVSIAIDGRTAGRPDVISFRLYGTPLFKWVLILFNNVINPFDGWPQNGTVIKAPSRNAVWREL